MRASLQCKLAESTTSARDRELVEEGWEAFAAIPCDGEERNWRTLFRMWVPVDVGTLDVASTVELVGCQGCTHLVEWGDMWKCAYKESVMAEPVGCEHHTSRALGGRLDVSH